MSIIKKLIIIVTTISILIVPTVIEAQIDYQNVINQINDLEEININNIDKVVPKLNEINELYLSLDTESQKLVTNYNVLEDMLNSNASRYDTDKLISNTSSVLSGKNIGFLGSSITYGFSSEGISFVDYIGKIDNCKTIKQAISGGTLAYLPDRPELNPEKSYVKQMIDNLDSDLKLDCLVVQLSTNDLS